MWLVFFLQLFLCTQQLNFVYLIPDPDPNPFLTLKWWVKKYCEECRYSVFVF